MGRAGIAVLLALLTCAAFGQVGEAVDGADVPPPGPELTLSVNGAIAATVTPGTPLVLVLQLRNAAAMSDAVAASAQEGLRAEMDRLVKEGQVTRERADELLAAEPVPAPVPALSVTLSAEAFAFRAQTVEGETAGPWVPLMVTTGEPAALSLGDENIAVVTFVVGPEATRLTGPGTYRLNARYASKAGTPGVWQGTAASDEVEVTVVAAADAPTAEDQVRYQKALGEYCLVVKDFAHAVDAANALLAVEPQSIDGLSLLGRAREARGEETLAFEAYGKALTAFVQRYPTAEEPPWELMGNARRLRERLGLKLPGTATPAP